jgi:hypothetical protein
MSFALAGIGHPPHATCFFRCLIFESCLIFPQVTGYVFFADDTDYPGGWVSHAVDACSLLIQTPTSDDWAMARREKGNIMRTCRNLLMARKCLERFGGGVFLIASS